MKDDRVIHEERRSQISADSLRDLVTKAFVLDQPCLTAINNLQTAAQFPVKTEVIDSLSALNGIGKPADTIGAAAKARIKILNDIESMFSETIPDLVTKELMRKVDRIRPLIGKRSISPEEVTDTVTTIVTRQIDADQYDEPARKYVEKAATDISVALAGYINVGIDDGKAFPRDENKARLVF